MPRSGPRQIHKYSEEFKLAAVRLSQVPGMQVKAVATTLLVAGTEDLNLDGFARSARAHLADGLSGFVVAGFTGEAALLAESVGSLPAAAPRARGRRWRAAWRPSAQAPTPCWSWRRTTTPVRWSSSNCARTTAVWRMNRRCR